MGPYRRSVINRHLQKYDPTLYATVDFQGVPCVYKVAYRYEECSYQGITYVYPVRDDHYIFALTDDWKPSGNIVDLGIEPIMEHVQEIDGHRHEIWKQLCENYEKRAKSDERHRDSENEAFFKDFRRQFAKATEHINTSCLEKIDKRRNYDVNRKS